MSVANRKAWRAQIASELAAVLAGAGKPAQALYAGQVADFDGLYPVVVVSSGGSDRLGDNGSAQFAGLYLNVDVFVRYSDKANNWDELKSEDALDDIEQIVAEWVQANGNRPPVAGSSIAWTNLAYVGRTDAERPPALIGGQEYRWERISLRVDIQGAI